MYFNFASVGAVRPLTRQIDDIVRAVVLSSH